jgi:hypothetical protein
MLPLKLLPSSHRNLGIGHAAKLIGKQAPDCRTRRGNRRTPANSFFPLHECRKKIRRPARKIRREPETAHRVAHSKIGTLRPYATATVETGSSPPTVGLCTAATMLKGL